MNLKNLLFKKKLKVNKIVRTCYAAPTQWEGYFNDGDKLYIRYRWGYLSVRKDKTNAVRGKEIFGKQIGDSFDGYMDHSELKKIVKIIKFPDKEVK